jgi:ribonuclease R
MSRRRKRPPGTKTETKTGTKSGGHAAKRHAPEKSRGTTPDSAGSGDMRAKILKLLAARALDKTELSENLGVPADKRAKFRELLRRMEVEGDVARIRKDRYVIPSDADLFTGTIQFHPSGGAHILNEKPGGQDLYVSAENTFTAMHGDRVVARVNPAETPRRDDLPLRGRPAGRREGRVIRILTRASETLVGTLQKSKAFFYVVADDPRFVHNLYVPAPAPPLDARIGDKVVAHLEAWPSRHVNPEGKIIEVLGAADAPGVDMLSIIRKHRLPEGFPDDVVREAEAVGTAISPRDLAGREDLRERFVLTIDPDDARDFDDAIEVTATARGWSVAVHIADVSHYVRPRGALDREARARGNSVYLADRVIPMLPEALSNGICSLRPDEDRLVFSVFAEVGSNGRVHAARFGRSVIRSAARLTYKEALARLERPPEDEISRRLHAAWDAASVLRAKRFSAGSLDLDFPEVKVWLDADGRPTRLERLENDISHQLVEELMLLANETVARELKLNRQPTVYRIHEKPEADRLAEFRETAASFGVKCGDLTNRAELQRLLADVRGKPFEHAVKIALLKSLKRARYATNPEGHYGLHKSDYTHFTSPIRRYADLVVHRSLERHLGLTKHGPDSSTLPATADHISTTERTAADAERESVRLKKLEFFKNQLETRKNAVFKARILDIRNFGIVIELPDCLLTGLIHVSSIEGDFYVYDRQRGRLVGRRTRRVFAVGGEMDVTVARVDMFKQQVDFRPV